LTIQPIDGNCPVTLRDREKESDPCMHGRKDPVQSSHVGEEQCRPSKYVREQKGTVFSVLTVLGRSIEKLRMATMSPKTRQHSDHGHWWARLGYCEQHLSAQRVGNMVVINHCY
jgi:hypothetical protein